MSVSRNSEHTFQIKKHSIISVLNYEQKASYKSGRFSRENIKNITKSKTTVIEKRMKPFIVKTWLQYLDIFFSLQKNKKQHSYTSKAVHK